MYVCKYSAAPAHARTRAHRPVYGCQSGSRGKGGLYRTVIGACAFGPEPEEGRRLCACVVGLFCVNPKPIYESQSGSRGDLHRTGPGLVRLLACEGGGGGLGSVSVGLVCFGLTIRLSMGVNRVLEVEMCSYGTGIGACAFSLELEEGGAQVLCCGVRVTPWDRVNPELEIGFLPEVCLVLLRLYMSIGF